MERPQKISEFRAKLDKTLASPDLVNKECIKKLVANQLLRSETQGLNDVVVEKRSKQVMDFLDLLRSASGDDHSKPSTRNDWKVKEDNEAYRVMYREGIQGTPFHTLIIEGHVDAPADVGLSAAWETALYRKWWPNLTVPTFKIAAAHCLKKIAINEHISTVRLKLLWPLSARELIIHYFEVEYFEDDFVMVLINTISTTENISEKTHGFSIEGIPEAKDIVRMDFLGGTCMKKLSPNKTYFRTVGNLDMKLDFVPAWLINFIARQLMGGACKLYQKVVPAVAQGDEDFDKALKDTIYVRIREALYSNDKQKKNGQVNVIESDKSTPVVAEKCEIETQKADTLFKCQASRPDNLLIVESTAETLRIQENEGEKTIEEGDNSEQKEVEVERTNVSKNKKVHTSEEVQGANLFYVINNDAANYMNSKTLDHLSTKILNNIHMKNLRSPDQLLIQIMERPQTIAEFRAKLDKTLASPDLVNKEYIKKLVANQLLRSETQGLNDVVVEKRSKQVMDFLDLLRSASGDDHSKASTRNDWKVKEDNEAYRVMYREGLQGTPFHTLLIEGHVDAPVDVGVSAAWETTLYRKWWPYLTVPTFKITAAHRLKKIAINEHISTVRCKLLWPLSAREVIVHYFEVEYFEDDFVILLLNTISDTENISENTHGFSTEGIPEAKDIVRMGFLGGTCMKKLSPNKTYFRTVGNLDIKLDFVPAWLINFIARQLMGGACKLYQKIVPKVAQGDEDFAKALKDTIYVRIREALYSNDKLRKDGQVNVTESDKSTSIIAEKRDIETQNADTLFKCQASRPDNLLIVESTSHTLEIQENKGEKPTEKGRNNGKEKEVEVKQTNVSKNKVYISEEVQGALGILDNVIEMVHRGELHDQTCIGLHETINHHEVQSLESAVIPKVESNSLIDETFLPSGATEIENIEASIGESHKPDTINYR